MEMDATKMKHIFISFMTQEADLAKMLKKWIEIAFDGQCEAFVSNIGIGAGEIWQEEITTKLKECSLFLVLCSPFSITRQWVNFESGAATILDKTIIPICHSGQRSKNLPHYLALRQAMEVQHSGFVEALITKLAKNLRVSPIDSLDYNQFEKDIDQAIEKIVEGRGARKNPINLKYLSVSITKIDDFTIRFNADSKPLTFSKPLKETDEKKWFEKVEEMNLFLRDPSQKQIKDVGLAIGIQNCLFDGSNIYVGVRMKAEVDANFTAVCVAQGLFNTGYRLLRESSHTLRYDTESTLHDLFVMRGEWVKQPVTDSSPIYKTMSDILKAAGKKIWRIQLTDDRIFQSTVFVNDSKWFPRFEVGIWKYIDITSLQKDGIVPGFGEDLYADYRGQEDIEAMKINYWIWVKDGEIFYWSFPEERFIPRYKPTKNSAPKHSVLVSTKYMIETYGKPEQYTPFASDEVLGVDNIIKDQFGLPARALLTCF